MGKSVNGEFNFQASVDLLKLEFEKVLETDPEILKINPSATTLDVKHLKLEIGGIQSDQLEPELALLV